ncbi:anthranilate phosphoribosyltransferase [Parvularcula sp. IMCC14364]|uniref:anthranilate phosphoribosyltransferase n=1 Tax=Parvularcula sp. IMCC14364 TaxID=3067902 RepID=UPI00274066C2|nr:anthranilate phosphoribosyltransferase [Parvularcula sp. IMCC14364]
MMNETMTFSDIVRKSASGDTLQQDQMAQAMQEMLSGNVKPVQIATFLTALKMRGETPAELAAAAYAMRQEANRFNGPEGCLDTCGTGGDGAHTYNISTAVAFVLAGCGVPVAKHGNKAVSSSSGSSDVLAELGVNLMAPMDVVKNCLDEIGITFLFAQRHHPAVRHVAPVRQDMGVRTLFNLLGPLTNPAGAKHQLLGVFNRSLTAPVAEVLQQLGGISAWVVHGSDGLDELTTTGPSFVSALADGNIRHFDVTPNDAGLDINTADEIRGGDISHNATALHAMLEGEKSAYRNIVLFNAAAGLIVAGRAVNLKDGASRAAEAIDTGKAARKLQLLVERTNA